MAGSRIPDPLTTREVLDLPAAVPLTTAARALGRGRTWAYEAARDGTFPIEVLRLGSRWYVRRADLLAYLGITDEAAAER